MTRIRTIFASLALVLASLLPIAPPATVLPPLATGVGVPIAVAMALTSAPAQAQSLTDFAENKAVDALLRGQTLSAPATMYWGLATAATSCDAGTITEVSTSGTGYARTGVAASLANWAGTQSAGSTTASSGTGGQTSNNSAITIGSATTTNWGSVTHAFGADAATAGNIWICFALTTPKTINAGDSLPSFGIGALTVTIQ